MIVPLLILGIATASAEGLVIPKYCPTCILVNTTCYNVSHVLDLDAPFRTTVVIPKMGILRAKNVLFYSFEPLIEDPEYYKIGFVNLDEDNSTMIISSGQMLNFGTFDIDQDNKLVYFGGSDGIYVLDTNSNKMSWYSSRGDTITNIFFKNFVYFTIYGEKGIKVKRSADFGILYEDVLVKKFLITKYDVFVILSNAGLFVSKGDVMHNISKNVFIRGITMDLDGTLYAWWIDELYKIVLTKNLINSKLVKVAEIPVISAMTFDNENNILFTFKKSLYVMKETNPGCGVVVPEKDSFRIEVLNYST